MLHDFTAQMHFSVINYMIVRGSLASKSNLPVKSKNFDLWLKQLAFIGIFILTNLWTCRECSEDNPH